MTTHGAWYNVFLPRNYNDGRPIEPGKFDALARELIGRFGGMTEFKEPAFPLQGSWMGLGLLQTEDVFIYGVFATDVNAARAFFDEAVERWKDPEMLDQEALLVTEMVAEILLK